MNIKVKTLSTVTQTGAQLFITLAGQPEQVMTDAFRLFNNGIGDLPEDYREGKDEMVTLTSNLYRIEKFAKADLENKVIARGGWRAMRRLHRSGKVRDIVKEKTRGIVRNIRTSCERYVGTAVAIHAIGGHGRAGEWSE